MCRKEYSKLISRHDIDGMSNVYIISNYDYLCSDINSDTDGMSNVYHIVSHVFLIMNHCLIMNQVMISIDVMSNPELLNCQMSTQSLLFNNSYI